MKTTLILCFLFLTLLSGCSSIGKISVRESEQFQGTAVMHYPMIAKIKIGSEKIKHVYSSSCDIKKECDILAYYDALEEHKIDGIIEPIYYHGVSTFSNPQITVIGYPYTYTEFREVTASDKELLSSPGSTWIPMQTNNRSYITNNADATPPTWQIILATTLTTASVTMLIAVAGR